LIVYVYIYFACNLTAYSVLGMGF